jgi:hypothetical protein
VSALWLLLVAGVWAGLTWALWKGWRRWRAAEGGGRRARDAMALVIGVLWVGVSSWYAGGRKVYYDRQVNRLCRQDGGVKVYETVKLPAERFDKFGIFISYQPSAKEPLGNEYSLERHEQYYRYGNPEVRRVQYRVIRRSDGRLLGEGVSYHRMGGDLPGPWHHTSFRCPKETAEAVVYKVFLKSE